MTIFLKKNFEYTFDDMLEIGLKIGIESNKIFQSSSISGSIDFTAFMVFDTMILYKLEKHFIDNGILFEWIEYKNQELGILADVDKEYNYQTLKEYQKFRNIIDLKHSYKFNELVEFMNKKENNVKEK